MHAHSAGRTGSFPSGGVFLPCETTEYSKSAGESAAVCKSLQFAVKTGIIDYQSNEK